MNLRIREGDVEAGAIEAGFDRTIDALIQSREQLGDVMLQAADLMTATYVRERAVLAAGNGGSAAQALHLAAELVGRFKVPGRPGLPVIPLCADTATLTAWANDVGFEDVFARGVDAFGRPGDLLVGFSTSGRSPNLVRAFDAARARGLDTLALLGGDGGDLLALADVAIVVPSSDTQSIQDVQGTLVHMLCELVELRLVEGGRFSLDGRAGARLRAVGPGRAATGQRAASARGGPARQGGVATAPASPGLSATNRNGGSPASHAGGSDWDAGRGEAPLAARMEAGSWRRR